MTREWIPEAGVKFNLNTTSAHQEAEYLILGEWGLFIRVLKKGPKDRPYRWEFGNVGHTMFESSGFYGLADEAKEEAVSFARNLVESMRRSLGDIE